MRHGEAHGTQHVLLLLLLLPAGCGGAGTAARPPAGTFEPSRSDECEGTAVDASRWHVMDEHQDANPLTIRPCSSVTTASTRIMSTVAAKLGGFVAGGS